MGKEIERKFLVIKEKWNSFPKPKGIIFRQGYLLLDPQKTIRVRVTEQEGFITIKGKTEGSTRSEFEYSIPREEAIELLDQFSVGELSKTRYKISIHGKLWEIDEFDGENKGLLMAEIELENEEESFEIPDFIGEEVTHEPRYYNANLVQHPFNNWQ